MELHGQAPSFPLLLDTRYGVGTAYTYRSPGSPARYFSVSVNETTSAYLAYHIKEVDLVGGLAPIKGALLHHRNPVVIGEGIHHRGTHTAAGCAPAHQQCIHLKLRQIADQRRPEECAGLHLPDDDVPLFGCYLLNDLIAPLRPLAPVLRGQPSVPDRIPGRWLYHRIRGPHRPGDPHAPALLPGQPKNVGQTVFPGYADKLDEALAEYDQVKRAKLLQEAEDILVIENAATVWDYSSNRLSAWRDYVKDYKPHPATFTNYRVIWLYK